MCCGPRIVLIKAGGDVCGMRINIIFAGLVDNARRRLVPVVIVLVTSPGV
jgi:hypothetical protein